MQDKLWSRRREKCLEMSLNIMKIPDSRSKLTEKLGNFGLERSLELGLVEYIQGSVWMVRGYLVTLVAMVKGMWSTLQLTQPHRRGW